MRIDDTKSKRDIIRDTQAMDERYRAQIARQVDSINRLLGHTMTESAPVPMYESELMDLNDRLAKADVQMAAYLDIIRRVRQHAMDTGNDRLRDIVGEVGMHGFEINSSAAGEPATLGS